MKKTTLLIFAFFYFGIHMCTAQSLPPFTKLVAENQSITADNFGTSYHFWPLNWYAKGYPVPYGVTPADHRLENPHGNPNLELLNQYESARWVRNFYPAIETIWHPTQKLSNNVVEWFLKELDFHHTNGKKFLWAGKWFNNEGNVLSKDVNSKEYERNLVSAITELLTSKITSDLGYTVASHPALAAIEFNNEQINSTTVNNYNNAYARFVRIVTKLFQKYKPDCRIITFSGVGGEGFNFAKILEGNAESIVSISTNGDDGTGKTAAGYIDIVSWHFYNFHVETYDQYKKDVANNGFSSRNNLFLSQANLMLPIKQQNDSNASILEDKDFDIWNTESGITPLEKFSPYDGGMRWFRMTRKERFEALMKWFTPTLFQNGKTTVSWAYKSDLPGIKYLDYPGGTQGTMTEISSGKNGRIRFKPSSTPSKGWLENMSIVITGPEEGWPDLNLLAGEKRRFEISLVSENLLEIQNSIFTKTPKFVPSYTEYQLYHSPYPEEFKQYIDLLKSGLVTFGWIYYPNEKYPGIYVAVKGKGKWYTTRYGELKQWESNR
ncbi:hypothetical protein FEE95_03665 [Maribacter algarum]|uniref:Uncharacterized protein n=2 Tax=Maribacter algarum (ex Zhang et al. 2020) TaxID=2578118 RepID=A0A5S3PUB9_9FLAO|nr:hypothetical protein FEE95_03665 [Maribacter algarum]